MSPSALPAADAFEALSLLDSSSCDAITREVMARDCSWVARHPLAPYFTLGAASSMDAVGDDGPEAYLALARHLNPVLDDSFGLTLFDPLLDLLSTRLKAPVMLAKDQARPGFHIFLAHAAFEQPVSAAHCDMQYELLDWGPGVLDAVLSFTLPIALPASGGGLDVWQIDRDDWLELAPGERTRALATQPRQDVRFTPGTLILHAGRLVHRLAASQGLGANERSVTLQGHGVLIDGIWQLYW